MQNAQEEDLFFEPEPEEAHLLSSQKKDPRIKIIIKIISSIHRTLGELISFLESEQEKTSLSFSGTPASLQKLQNISACTVIEGVFNGQHMVGSDGQIYPVPANYASKSRLVEGDLLKLIIQPSGNFLFKQIGPIARRRRVGKMAFDTASQSHVVLCEDEIYTILEACITYHGVQPGDEVVIVVPEQAPSHWAAVENVIKKLTPQA